MFDLNTFSIRIYMNSKRTTAGRGLPTNFTNFDKVETTKPTNPNLSLKRKIIDDELRDLAMMSGNTRAAIREMNGSFEGEQEVNYTANVDRNDKLRV